MKKFIEKIGNLIKGHVFLSFFLALILLFILIFAGNQLRSAQDENDVTEIQAKPVVTIRVSDGQYTQLSGKVEKEGIVTIMSHVPGVVHSVYVSDGQSVVRGTGIAYIADTYGGGSVASVAHEIARRQAQTQDETFEKRIGMIDDQRDSVKKTNDIDAEIARKQYTLQKRNTELEHDVVKLQQKQSVISAARQRPTAPFAGTIERVFVNKGDTINVGDRIAVLRGDNARMEITVHVSVALASMIDVDMPSCLVIGGEEVLVLPRYLSRSVTEDQSYVISYDLDERYADFVTNDQFIDIKVPLESHVMDGGILVPLDAVHLMSDKAIIFVAEKGHARAREVVIGNIVGGFIVVRGGVGENDHLIINRNVFDGDLIEEGENDN